MPSALAMAVAARPCAFIARILAVRPWWSQPVLSSRGHEAGLVTDYHTLRHPWVTRSSFASLPAQGGEGGRVQWSTGAPAVQDGSVEFVMAGRRSLCATMKAISAPGSTQRKS